MKIAPLFFSYLARCETCDAAVICVYKSMVVTVTLEDSELLGINSDRQELNLEPASTPKYSVRYACFEPMQRMGDIFACECVTREINIAAKHQRR